MDIDIQARVYEHLLLWGAGEMDKLLLLGIPNADSCLPVLYVHTWKKCGI